MNRIMKIINQKFILIICFFVLFGGVLLISEKYSQSFHFVDEDDHLVFASFINKDYKLYTDLSTNHQPLVYFLSSLTQKAVKPTTLFTLIKSGREAVFLYSFIASLFLFFYFGPIFLLFSLFFELTKFFIFGNLLLSESLVVYPLVFILGESFRTVFFKKPPKSWQGFIFGLCNFLIFFNLLPLIPGILAFDIIFLLKTKKLKSFLVGLILPTILLFLFVNPLDYFRETIVYNVKYVVPVLAPVKGIRDMVIIFLFPFLSFINGRQSIMNQFIQFFTIILLINFILLIYKKKIKKILWWVLFFLLILSFNNRNLVPGEMFYTGFHLLPWYAAFIFFNLLTLKINFSEIKSKIKYILIFLLILGGGILFSSRYMPYLVAIDKNYEHNINFYPYYVIGKAINAVADSKDSLAVLPDESLIYWLAGTKLATRQVIYHSWEYQAPLLKEQMDKVFTVDPPDFIYINYERVKNAGYVNLINEVLAKEYWQANIQGIAQKLYLKKSKIKAINENQWQEWTKLSFDKINL